MAEMMRRHVRYAELQPCTSAFIDTRSPGSERKENFTIIGPGVAENPEQHVHIRIPHGFNIGGARQPAGCTNSQHSHETAEVFVVHTGGFRFKTGEHGTSGFVDLGPGDVISIPVRAFRGFDTLGTHESFMFSVLGGDDPGHVMWAPYVFETAREYGLVLLSSGRLIDTLKGETIPEGDRPMPVTSAADMARLKDYDTAAIAACTVKQSEFKSDANGPFGHLPGVEECPIIGAANPAEGMRAGRLTWSHGFHLRALHLAGSAVVPSHARFEPEVLLMHKGRVCIDWDGGSLELGPGDTLTVPVGLYRTYRCVSADTARVYVVRGGDAPAAPRFA
jgi:mannose-6-phosphate isomerase-like protein (cupin superfamily)